MGNSVYALYEIVLIRLRGGRRRARNVQLDEDVAHVPGDRLLANDEIVGDFPVGLAFGQVSKNLKLTAGQTPGEVGGRPPGESIDAGDVGRGAEPLENRSRRVK